MRLTRCALGVILLGAASAAPQSPQTQHQIDVPHNTTGVDMPKTTGNIAQGGPPRYQIYIPQGASPTWLQQRSADLLDLLACYLDKDSLANEVAAEVKNGDDAMSVIETRIKVLKAVAQNNGKSHCK